MARAVGALRRNAGRAIAVVGVLVLSACDPNKDVGKYYAKLGLSPMASPQTGLKPGLIVLVNNKGDAARLSSMYDEYIQGGPKGANSVAPEDPYAMFEAVLREVKVDRKVSPDIAIKFLTTMLGPIAGAFKMDFASTVAIAPVNANGQGVTIKQFEDDLNGPAGAGLRRKISALTKQGHLKAYVAYETFSTNTLDVCADSNLNVTTSISVGETKTTGDATTSSTPATSTKTGDAGGKDTTKSASTVKSKSDSTKKGSDTGAATTPSARGCVVTPTGKTPSGEAGTTAAAGAPKTDTAKTAGDTAKKNTIKKDATANALKNDATTATGAASSSLPSGHASLSMTHAEVNHLQIKGDTQYVFALRTGLLMEQSDGSFFVNPTKFAYPSGFGVKGAKDNERYSAPLKCNQVTKTGCDDSAPFQLQMTPDLTKFK